MLEAQKQIQLVRMTLQETGTYNTNYSRPYNAVTTDETLAMLEHRVDEITRGNPLTNVAASSIAGLSAGLIVPATAWDHEILIPNGWDTKRLRFLLEVHADTHFGTEVYFFQGYSEEFGVSYTNNIDPRMTFFINSYIRINRQPDLSGMVIGGYRDVVVESAQIIDGRIHSQTSPSVYGLRPEDLFTGIQANYLQSSYSSFGQSTLKDDRENRAGDVFKSNRMNAVPSAFLSKVVGAHRSAAVLQEYGSGNADILERTMQNCFESTPYENIFIRALSNLTGITGTTTFTLEDLELIDQSFRTRIDYHELGETVRLHRAGDTNNNWGNATMETQLATILTQAISGLMMDSMLIQIGFHATTLTMNGMLDIRPFEDSVRGVNGGNMTGYLARFFTRFESEVMPDITHNGDFQVDLNVYADLYGETEIQLSINGKHHEVFVTPSFCDALMAPIVTTNTENYHALVTGVEQITNYASFGKNGGGVSKIYTDL